MKIWPQIINEFDDFKIMVKKEKIIIEKVKNKFVFWRNLKQYNLNAKT